MTVLCGCGLSYKDGTVILSGVATVRSMYESDLSLKFQNFPMNIADMENLPEPWWELPVLTVSDISIMRILTFLSILRMRQNR